MAVSFHIIPDRGIVVVRYSGHATIDDTMAATKAYVSDPDYVAGQKQLIDVSRIESYEKDYVRFMQMQASKAERFINAGVQSMVLYYAPSQVALEVATMFVRSWDDVDAVVPLIQHSEADALALLGQPETTIDALLETLVK